MMIKGLALRIKEILSAGGDSPLQSVAVSVEKGKLGIFVMMIWRIRLLRLGGSVYVSVASQWLLSLNSKAGEKGEKRVQGLRLTVNNTCCSFFVTNEKM